MNADIGKTRGGLALSPKMEAGNNQYRPRENFPQASEGKARDLAAKKK